eukprot:Clim_evm4s153 gene=Clim_evmTU4s153
MFPRIVKFVIVLTTVTFLGTFLVLHYTIGQGSVTGAVKKSPGPLDYVYAGVTAAKNKHRQYWDELEDARSKRYVVVSDSPRFPVVDNRFYFDARVKDEVALAEKRNDYRDIQNWRWEREKLEGRWHVPDMLQRLLDAQGNEEL